MNKNISNIRGDDAENNHPIQVVARYTGLSSDLIRAWEKRYQVVRPARSGNNRRLYSNSDIQRLSLLKQVTQFGRRISEVARLPLDELVEMVKRDETAVARRTDHGEARLSTGSVMEMFDRCFDAVKKLDMHRLQTTLDEAFQELGVVFLLEDLISPLLHHVAEECREGELPNCHQLLFTEAIRGYLITLSTRNDAAQNNFIACSMAQDPALTALRAAVMANSHGWNPVYLGERVVCNEIFDAASRTEATAVVVSFGDSSDDVRVPNEMRRLAALLPKQIRLIINAPDACSYSSILNEEEALHVHNSGELRLELNRLAAGEPE